jgi:hypothetical protein
MAQEKRWKRSTPGEAAEAARRNLQRDFFKTRKGQTWGEAAQLSARLTTAHPAEALERQPCGLHWQVW